jgi:hypothetical protein
MTCQHRVYIASQLLALTLLMTGTGLCHAESVYKWVDETGRVHYGDRNQRPTTTQTERIVIDAQAPDPAQPAASADDKASGDNAATDKDATDKDAKDKAAKDKAAAAKPEKPQVSAAEKRKLCSQARSELATITSHGQVREQDKKGNTVYLTEKQRQDRINAANKRIRENCR